ncbi:MAG: hypothetical protein ACFFHV_10845 [Promethearchaeota archaeon]
MSLIFFISPITSPSTVILWDKVSLISYVRAFTILIGCAYLPGANIYSLIFHENNLHEKFKVEPFLLKITIYPLLSLFIIGFSVLIIDQIGFNNEFFVLILLMVIVGLFLLDIIVQIVRKNKIELIIKKIDISKETLIILIISIGIIFIAVGIHLGVKYLIPGDSWIGLAPCNYIGSPNTSPIEWGANNLYYPIFWSYIIYGLSILCGLPYLNTNALLAPFCYIYATSIYLLMKAILYDFKEKYATLSTILITISSGLFYISSDYGYGRVPAITFTCEFYFIYKSYAYLLLIIALALFIIVMKTIDDNKIDNQPYFNLKEYKLLILASLFLILTATVYLFPLLMGLIIIFIYCFFSDNIKKNFSLFSTLLFFIFIIFIFLDILMSFYLSSSTFLAFQWFFQIGLFTAITHFIPFWLFTYSIIGSVVIASLIIQLIFSKYFKLSNNMILKLELNYPNYKYFLIFFTVLLTIEIIAIILEEFFLDFKLDEKFTFFFYLDKIFLNIGFIGIIAIYLFYYSFEKDKKLFFPLISWVLTMFLIASLFIFLFWFQTDPIRLNSINKGNRFVMDFWFKRIWLYSIIPLCILAAIGLFKLTTRIKNRPFFKTLIANKTRTKALKLSFLSLLIFLSNTQLIFAGIYSGSATNAPKDEEIELLSWMSENIPLDSNFLIDNDYIIRIGIFSMVNGRYFFIKDYFKSDYNETENIERIDDLIDDNIEYLLIHEDLLYDSSNSSRFIRNYLIPNFYNESEHRTTHYRLYYAPYFD